MPFVQLSKRVRERNLTLRFHELFHPSDGLCPQADRQALQLFRRNGVLQDSFDIPLRAAFFVNPAIVSPSVAVIAVVVTAMLAYDRISRPAILPVYPGGPTSTSC